jgi:hypothetical protein
MLSAPRAALVAATFAIVACTSSDSTVAFRGVRSVDRVDRAAYLPHDATALADVPGRSGISVVLARRPCSQSSTCAYDVTAIDGVRALEAGSIIGTTIVRDGVDESGVPRFRVDGDRCAFFPSGTTAHGPAGAYLNLDATESVRKAVAIRRIGTIPASADAVRRGRLRERTQAPSAAGYVARPVSIFLGGGMATLVSGTGSRAAFALFAGPPNALGRVLLEQIGSVAISQTRSNGANDVVVTRSAIPPLVYRYYGTRYAPAPCQDAAALDPGVVTPHRS